MIFDNKYILVTSISTNLSEREIFNIVKSRENYFKKVHGLIRKFWTRDEKTGIYHGIFEFESKQHLEDYLKTDFANSVSNVYKTKEPVKLQVLKVQKEQAN